MTSTSDQAHRKRQPCHVFDLPVHELRRGYLSDVYFRREKQAFEKGGVRARGLMQVFQKNKALLCGVDEALAVLKVASGRYADEGRAAEMFGRLQELERAERETFFNDRERHARIVGEKTEVSLHLDDLWEDHFDTLDVRALRDGDEVEPWETVLTIEGEMSLFAHLETIYLGVLARRTLIATNVRRVVEVANGKPILYFPARFDHWAVQQGDGHAARVGGAAGVSTDAQAEWWGGEGMGTVPHAMIAGLGGDTVEAVRLFHETFPDVNLVALVDFDNDNVNTALACARAMGDRLWGVRLDTSEKMVDKSVFPHMGDFTPTGVNPLLARLTREALDAEGFDHVKIVVSGGFDTEKIAAFEAAGAPVDAYGVGSSLMRGAADFTADIVRVDGRATAKAGRCHRPNSRLEKVET